MAADASEALAVRDKVMQFLEAARIGNINLLKKIAKQLDEGRGLATTIADIKDANKRGALHFAAHEGKTEVCKYLLKELNLHSIVNAADEEGDTPLLLASCQGHVDTTKYLVKHGADATISNNFGSNGMHHAAAAGNLELLLFFLDKRVNVDIQSAAGTPLIWAAGSGQPEAVKFLLENHANPNVETDDSVTPLLSAVAAGSVACLELLVQAGASTNISAGGTTPMHIAADNGAVEIISCLLKAGCNPNTTDEDGLVPIQVAACRGNNDAVSLLLPMTSPLPNISDWSVEGIIKHEKCETVQVQLREGTQWSQPLESTIRNSQLSSPTPEARIKAFELKARGDEAFRRKDYLVAIDSYTQAIDVDPSNGTFLSNRSLCWLHVGQADQALADAQSCRVLRPDWPKACYREGAALRLLQRFDEAASAFYEGIKLAPENKDLVHAFRESIEAGKKFHA